MRGDGLDRFKTSSRSVAGGSCGEIVTDKPCPCEAPNEAMAERGSDGRSDSIRYTIEDMTMERMVVMRTSTKV
jgi:hypothetical protein